MARGCLSELYGSLEAADPLIFKKISFLMKRGCKNFEIHGSFEATESLNFEKYDSLGAADGEMGITLKYIVPLEPRIPLI